jgi:hypothetical protein
VRREALVVEPARLSIHAAILPRQPASEPIVRVLARARGESRLADRADAVGAQDYARPSSRRETVERAVGAAST